MDFHRSSGILLHITSLPGNFGIGTFGEEAYAFVDFLVTANQKLWQLLPLGYTGYGNSPYQCFSAFAGNPLLISLEKLVQKGLLEKDDLKTLDDSIMNSNTVHYEKVKKHKSPLLLKAFEKFIKTEQKDFELFCNENSPWLNDFALYLSLKDQFSLKPWNRWPRLVRIRESNTIETYKNTLSKNIYYHKFVQYIFFSQWYELKEYAHKKGIKIIGDIPLYISYDSADAWTHPEIFLFNKNGVPKRVSGVPPDYFSKTGQLWGNPVFNWEYLEQNGFTWWIERVKANLKLFDIIRIDHFRGLVAYWSVPFGYKTARKGEWVKAPGKKLFEALQKEIGKFPVIVEDLGFITQDVEELRNSLGYPGMKILQFAFDSKEDSNNLPHAYPKNCVVYTGTHDNNTTIGWYKSLSNSDKEFVKKYCGDLSEGIAKTLIKIAWKSPANTAIAPLQDVLELDEEARMNTPGTQSGNWLWKYKKDDLTEKHAEWLAKLTKSYYRSS
jgi:4-alpha-glucanotransferase